MSTPQLPAARRGQLRPHLAAGQVARLAPSGQRRARLVDQRAHLVAPASDHLGDLGVVEVIELGEHERHALVVGQAGDVGQQVAQVAAPLDLLGEPGAGRVKLPRRQLAACPQHGQAAVAGGGVQPGARVLQRFAVHQLPVDGGERVLQRVLGLLARAEHVPAEREHAWRVPLEHRLERRLVAVLGHPGGERAVVRVRQRAERAPGRLPWRTHCHPSRMSGMRPPQTSLFPTSAALARLTLHSLATLPGSVRGPLRASDLVGGTGADCGGGVPGRAPSAGPAR